MAEYKRVLIWDMDWQEKNSFVPKPEAMKVASYHKQQDSIIYFLEDKKELEFDYDMIYVFREKLNTSFPPLKILDGLNTRLFGREFIYYDSYWTPNRDIAEASPDYNLYPLSDKNIYKGAHIIQMLYNGQYLSDKQDFNNAIKQPRKKSLVIDEDLWGAEDEVILKVLNELRELNNIEFKHPISLRKILSNKNISKSFLLLHFIGGTNMPFKNDLGDTFEDAKKIVDFLERFRENFRVRLKPIKFHSVIYDHYKCAADGIKDLERILKIIHYGKSKKVYVEAVSPRRRLDTPYWAFFELLESWTKNNQYTSYVQAMLYSTTKRTGMKWDEILNNSKKWVTPRVWFLLHVWTKYPYMIKYSSKIWGENDLDLTKINLKSILKSVNIQEREDLLKIIQKEITGGDS